MLLYINTKARIIRFQNQVDFVNSTVKLELLLRRLWERHVNKCQVPRNKRNALQIHFRFHTEFTTGGEIVSTFFQSRVGQASVPLAEGDDVMQHREEIGATVR